MAGNSRFHDKQHRKNHHTLSSYGFADSATDPIASPSEPFQGDFVINGGLSCNKGFSVLSANIPGDIYCENMYIRSKTYTNFISGVNTETIISDGVLTGYGSNTLTLDYGKAIYSRINNTTVMYMNSSNVGIGTDSPTQKLHVVGNVLITGNLSALGDLTVLDTNVVTTSSMVIDTNATTDALRITQRGTGNVLVVEDSANPDSTPFVITNSGDVGIGTNIPTSKLYVNGALTLDSQQMTLSDVESKHLSAVYIKFNSPKFLDKEYAFLREIGEFNNFHLALDLHDDSNGNLGQAFSIRNVKAGIPNEINTNFTIDISGNVGIGITNPISKLHVDGDITVPNGRYLNLDTNNGGGNTAIRRNTGQNGMEFFTQSASRMFIADDGKVGIGSTKPNKTLTIDGSLSATGHLYLQSKNSNYAVMHLGSDDNAGWHITKEGATASTPNSLNIWTGEWSVTPVSRMAFLTSGNVGIGISNPNYKLDVDGPANFNRAGDTQSIRLSCDLPGNYIIGNCRYTNPKHLVIASDSNSFGIQLETNNATVMTVTSSGLVGIGTKTPTDKLQVSDAAGGSTNITRPAGWGGGITTWDIYAAGTLGAGNIIGGLSALISGSGQIMGKTLAGTGNRQVYSDASGYLTNTASDGTLKENVSGISQGLNDVLQLNPISFTWIDIESHGPQREIGFIAQEVQKIVPEVIGTNANGKLSLDYSKMIAVLTKSIQELNDKVEAQSQEIAQLKAKKTKKV